MAISRKEIDHIAELSRLSLSEEEKDKFSAQLDSILQYVGQLDEVDTKNVDITAQVSGLVDVWRDDKAQDWDRGEVIKALQQGELEGGQLKVRRVL